MKAFCLVIVYTCPCAIIINYFEGVKPGVSFTIDTVFLPQNILPN